MVEFFLTQKFFLKYSSHRWKLKAQLLTTKWSFNFFVFTNSETWNTGKKGTINKCNKALKNLKAELHNENKCSKSTDKHCNEKKKKKNYFWLRSNLLTHRTKSFLHLTTALITKVSQILYEWFIWKWQNAVDYENQYVRIADM